MVHSHNTRSNKGLKAPAVMSKKQQKHQKCTMIQDEMDVAAMPDNSCVLSLLKHLKDKGGLNGFMEEKKSKIIQATMHSKLHQSNCLSTEDSFFSALECDSVLKALTQIGNSGRHIFYELLEGPVAHPNIQLLNKCLILSLFSQKMQKPTPSCQLVHEKYADAACKYQPKSHKTYYKQLFSVFTKKGINYSMMDHFTFEGGFCSVMMKHFQEIAKQRTDYRTRPNHPAMDPNYDENILKARASHIHGLVANQLGSQILLCGGKEISELAWPQVKFHFPIQDGEFEGLDGMEIVNLYDKTNQLTAFSTTACNDNFCFMAVCNPKDPFDLTTLMKK